MLRLFPDNPPLAKDNLNLTDREHEIFTMLLKSMSPYRTKPKIDKTYLVRNTYPLLLSAQYAILSTWNLILK